MKALSIKQPWATMLALGIKTIETRTWPTKYRGKFLITASSSPKINGLLSGYAIGIAEIIDCRPMTKEDQVAACCEVYPGAWSWVLNGARLIVPFPIKGSLKLFDVHPPECPEEVGLGMLELKRYLSTILRDYFEAQK